MARNQTEETSDAETADTPPKTKGPKKGKKKVILAVVALAIGGGAYKFVLAPAPAASDEDVPPEALALVEGEIIELPEVVINLADPETRYARVGLALVLEEGIVAKDFEAESAIAKDVALSYLSSYTYGQLRDPALKEQAKAELSRLVREAYGDAKVVRVLWTVLVMQ
jgi:flagellar protein FliL